MLKWWISGIVAALLLSGCSNGGSNSSAVPASSAPSAASSAPAPTLFGLPTNSRITVSQTSATQDETTGAVRSYAQDFWLKSRSATNAGADLRRIRYGRPFQTYHPHRNYTIPISVTNSSGMLVGTGSAKFSGTDVETGVTTRTINLTDIQLSNSVFGVFSVDDIGSRGDFFDIHAYAGGVAATGLPANATYTGRFVGDVVSSSALGSAQRLDLPADLTVDFSGATVAGTIGPSSTPDINLSGAISGTSMSGTATAASTNVVVANGSAGTFSGGFFGAGATDAAGIVGISDSSGATSHELVGAFGATKN